METERRVQWLRRLSLLLVVGTFAVMVLGSWVKATGSGLACPDWPQCYGDWLPPFPSADNGGTYEGQPVPYPEANILYEWSHRVLAALLGVPMLAFAVIALQGRELNPTLRRSGLLILVVLAIQGLLGGGTVLEGNPAYLTTLHLANAALLLILVTAAAALAFLRPLGTASAAAARHGQVAVLFPGETPQGATFPGEPGGRDG